MKAEELTADFLDWLKGVGEKSAEFIERESPLLAQEIVAWHFWSNAVEACLGILFASVFAAASAYAFRKWMQMAPISRDTPNEHDGKVLALGFGWGILAAIAVLILAIHLTDGVWGMAKASCAPRLVIIENLKGLAK